MRRLTLLLALFLFVAACQDGSKELIAGSWQYDMDATLEELKAQGADQNAVNFTQSIMIGLQGAKLDLKASGKAVFKMPDLVANGKWSLKQKGSEFHLQLDSIAQVSRVEYMSADTLILNSITEDEPGGLRVLTRP